MDRYSVYVYVNCSFKTSTSSAEYISNKLAHSWIVQIILCHTITGDCDERPRERWLWIQRIGRFLGKGCLREHDQTWRSSGSCWTQTLRQDPSGASSQITTRWFPSTPPFPQLYDLPSSVKYKLTLRGPEWGMRVSISLWLWEDTSS